MKIASTRTITNGGLEQALLELAQQEGVITDTDKARLEHLKSLPQNRTEVITEGHIKKEK